APLTPWGCYASLKPGGYESLKSGGYGHCKGWGGGDVRWRQQGGWWGGGCGGAPGRPSLDVGRGGCEEDAGRGCGASGSGYRCPGRRGTHAPPPRPLYPLHPSGRCRVGLSGVDPSGLFARKLPVGAGHSHVARVGAGHSHVARVRSGLLTFSLPRRRRVRAGGSDGATPAV
ncbi:hypothetical protein T484DRAFT_1910020, partial [Baffinella frigidus]